MGPLAGFTAGSLIATSLFGLSWGLLDLLLLGVAGARSRYVTAYIAGSMIGYTVDDATDGLVNGSRVIPEAVEEFWTFTRRAGLNFWMLSAVQAS